MKEGFITSEVWALSISAAFQRAYVYSPNANDENKKELKNALYQYCNELIKAQYHKEVSESQHLINIKELSLFTRSFTTILCNGQFNFGVSQKLLNLYLKYLWCLERIPAPPHFPVDRIIQGKLNQEAKVHNLKQRLQLKPWTKFEDEKPYLEVINFALKLLKQTKYNNLPHLELILFSEQY